VQDPRVTLTLESTTASSYRFGKVNSISSFMPVGSSNNLHLTEFQKRGPPHEHFLLVMESWNKLKTPDNYDIYFSRTSRQEKVSYCISLFDNK
jgi:hypothetical protein